MNTKENKITEIDRVFNSVDDIETVKASPFFKTKVLRELYEEKQERVQVLFPWFTPKLQLAALAVFVVLNVFVIAQMNSDNYTSEVSTFAEAYELTPETDITLFD